MSILRDDGDERQVRVNRMIEEFRTAQSRRRAKVITVKGGDRIDESQCTTHTNAAVARTTVAPRSSP